MFHSGLSAMNSWVLTLNFICGLFLLIPGTRDIVLSAGLEKFAFLGIVPTQTLNNFDFKKSNSKPSLKAVNYFRKKLHFRYLKWVLNTPLMIVEECHKDVFYSWNFSLNKKVIWEWYIAKTEKEISQMKQDKNGIKIKKAVEPKTYWL